MRGLWGFIMIFVFAAAAVGVIALLAVGALAWSTTWIDGLIFWIALAGLGALVLIAATGYAIKRSRGGLLFVSVVAAASALLVYAQWSAAFVATEFDGPGFWWRVIGIAGCGTALVFAIASLQDVVGTSKKREKTDAERQARIERSHAAAAKRHAGYLARQAKAELEEQ